MIALAGAYRLEQQKLDYSFTVKPRWSLSSLDDE
jgi:tRNA A37 threonylcarbamoyltransferase TsaD